MEVFAAAAAAEDDGSSFRCFTRLNFLNESSSSLPLEESDVEELPLLLPVVDDESDDELLLLLVMDDRDGEVNMTEFT